MLGIAWPGIGAGSQPLGDDHETSSIMKSIWNCHGQGLALQADRLSYLHDRGYLPSKTTCSKRHCNLRPEWGTSGIAVLDTREFKKQR